MFKHGFQRNDFKAVFFEFMANHSLDDWLHPKEDKEGELKKLNLMQRMNIAVDVASALDYLHHLCETPIIHCDLKPSNILLDDSMTAHVGDFGLAKFLKKKISRSSQHSSAQSVCKEHLGISLQNMGWQIKFLHRAMCNTSARNVYREETNE
ncbi:uncharacterized protein A4U43_C08F5350 [Asparagus officinalis]|nr:uncharacterized protein A4U43_C08F5350 [Asparagus officinalis]